MDGIKIELREYAKEVLTQANRDFGISRDYLTLNEVCKEFSVSKNTVMQNWHETKGLPIVRIDNKLYISKISLYDFMSKYEV